MLHRVLDTVFLSGDEELTLELLLVRLLRVEHAVAQAFDAGRIGEQSADLRGLLVGTVPATLDDETVEQADRRT